MGMVRGEPPEHRSHRHAMRAQSATTHTGRRHHNRHRHAGHALANTAMSSALSVIEQENCPTEPSPRATLQYLTSGRTQCKHAPVPDGGGCARMSRPQATRLGPAVKLRMFSFQLAWFVYERQKSTHSRTTGCRAAWFNCYSFVIGFYNWVVEKWGIIQIQPSCKIIVLFSLLKKVSAKKSNEQII